MLMWVEELLQVTSLVVVVKGREANTPLPQRVVTLDQWVSTPLRDLKSDLYDFYNSIKL